MIKVSTKTALLLATLILLGATAYGQSQDWPLKRTIDLSSGFGDFRANRFHAGIDLRTGGAIGARIYSPVDGYVWRVKMSYRGYGKGLYVKGDDGHFYVFAHLSRFIDPIAKVVLDDQFRKERYYVDVRFLRDGIRVKQGQLIAYSGQTGVGAPHLHFEKRSPDNVPINPLSHGFELDDSVPPTFARVGFHLRDDASLFPDGRRKLYLPVTRLGRGKYELDTVLILSGPFGVLADCYDQKRVGGMRQSVYKLTLSLDGVPFYEPVWDTLPFEIGPVVNLVFDPLEAANGEKRVRRLYHLYEPTAETRLATDSRSGLLRPAVDSDTSLHLLTIRAEDNAGNESLLGVSFRWGGTSPSVSWEEQGHRWKWVGYQVTEDGLAIRCINPALGLVQSFFVDGDVAEGSELANSLEGSRFYSLANSETVRHGDSFSIATPPGGLFQRRTIAIKKGGSGKPNGALLASDTYHVFPYAFPLRKPIEVSIKLEPGVSTNQQTGLCWYDTKEKEWIWIDEKTENDYVAAGSSLGGGIFAAIVDTTAPTISKLNIKRNHKYWNRKLRVKFILEDNLSGFENDQSLDIRIDDAWLLPELDFESGEVVATLRRPLDLGRHILVIKVTDRAGNQTEQQLGFDVIKKSK